MATIGSRFKNAWNAFLSREPTKWDYGQGSSRRPDRRVSYTGKEKTIINSITNRIAVDAASIDMKHVQLDKFGRYMDDKDSMLNECLTVEANIDQTGRAFMQDAVETMFDCGHVVIVPTEADRNAETGAFDVYSMRTGRVTQWYPQHVRVDLYNERTGKHEEITIRKSAVCIIQNPLYSIVNEPNSTVQRLLRKLALLDSIDEQAGAGKIDLIIQLPYSIRSEARRKEADKRRKDIETQLTDSKYGIAYTDGTEKITQLNRPLENNLLNQIEYLTNQVYAQLGITQAILDGSADEKTMLNYYSRTIEPILSAIAEEMKRKFLTKTARTQGQSIMFFRNPFKLVPISQIGDIADKMTRNEILTSNEVRQEIGYKPSSDPGADELRNKNLSAPADGMNGDPGTGEWVDPAVEAQLNEEEE